MSKTIKGSGVVYTDAPPEVDKAFENPIIVKGLIPTPEELAKSIKKHRISILLDVDTIDFFKTEAEQNGVKYQTMINGVLKSYAKHARAN